LKDSLIIPVQTIEQTRLSLACEEKPEAFPVFAELIRNGELVFTGPVTIAAKVDRVQDLIKAAGTVKTSLRIMCSRCLNEFEATMSDEFSFTFSKEIPKKDGTADTGEKELTAGEIGLIHFPGEHIDLHESIQEQVVMTLPQRPLCSESCKGLCPQCGKNLNQGDCDCRQPVLDDRLAVLKSFKVKTDDD